MLILAVFWLAATLDVAAAPVLGVPVSRDSQLQVESGYAGTRFYDQGPSRRWTLGESHLTTSFSQTLRGWRGTVSLRFVNPSGRIAYSGDDDLLLTVLPAEPHINADFQLHSPRSRLGVRLWSQLGRHDQSEGSASVAWQPLTGYFIGLEYARVHPIPYRTNLLYAGEGGVFAWAAQTSLWRYRFQAAPKSWWSLFARMTKATLSPGFSKNDPVDADGYLLHVDGPVQDDVMGTEVRPTATSAVRIEYRRLSADLRLLGYSDGNRFAHFGVADLSGHWWTIGYSTPRLLLEFRRGSAQGNLAGTVEAWPFIDNLARFLGERRHFVASGELAWKNFRVKHHQHIWRQVRLVSEVNYLFVEPIVQYKTWRPLFLGFGIDDLRQDRLNIRSAHLLYLQFSPTIELGRWRVDLIGGQWIPVAVRKWESDEPGRPADSSGGSRHRYAGFSFSMTLSYAL